MGTLRNLSLSTLFLFLISVSAYGQGLYNPDAPIAENDVDVIENSNDVMKYEGKFEEEIEVYNDDYNVEKDNGGFSFRIWVPGFLFNVASWFVPREEEPELKSILKKVGSISLMVKEGHKRKKRFDRKYKRMVAKANRKGFEELMQVNSADAKVSISAKTNRKNIIKKLLITVSADDMFVMVKAGGNFDLNEIAHLAQNADW